LPPERIDLAANDPDGPRSETIPILTYSTADLPPDERYRAWSLRDWPRSKPIYRTDPTEPFDTRWTYAQLGPVTFVHTHITAMRWERRLDDIRSSDFDPIIVGLMKSGLAHGDFDGRPFHEPAGTFHFHDLARPSLHVSTASETFGLVVPRPVATEWFGPLEPLHGLVVPEPAAAMVFGQAEQTLAALPTLDEAQAERLGRVFLELVAVALAGVRPKVAPRLSAVEALRGRAIALIESRLGMGEIGIPELCRDLGVARGRLFAAFRKDGGVQAFMSTRRLERAREALSDTSRIEPIGGLAHRLGFSDAAHLSRSFRSRYGMTPSAYRSLLDHDEALLTGERLPERGYKKSER
jgi:AraC-like DNA-binding protein